MFVPALVPAIAATGVCVGCRVPERVRVEAEEFVEGGRDAHAAATVTGVAHDGIPPAQPLSRGAAIDAWQRRCDVQPDERDMDVGVMD